MGYLFFLFMSAQAALYAQKSFAQITNFNNHPYNVSANNGIYDNSGNRVGYEAKAPRVLFLIAFIATM
jgi:hypothetical protein